MLSTPGIGSGLDISTIIDQLMAIEERPLVDLAAEKIELEARLSGFGSLKSAMSDLSTALDALKDPDEFRANRTEVSDETVLEASASDEASRGIYQFDVNRIAENHRLATGNVFADADTTKVGIVGDTVTITVGADAFTVEIGDKTLDEIRDEINIAVDNTGVTASLLQEDNGYHLTLTANDTGSDNFVSLTYSGADPFAMISLNADRDGSLVFDAVDLDAEILLENTFTVTRSTNSIADVIDGVTLNLLSAGSSTVAVSRDDARIQDSVEAFVDAYNNAFTTMDGLRRDVLTTERASLINLETQLRRLLSSEAGDSESFSYLFELGVTTQKDGTLELDSAALKRVLDTDAEAVVDVFTNPDNGLAVTLKAFTDSLNEAGGMLDSREESLNSQIRDKESEQTRLEFRIAQKEESLIEQYSALDALLAGLSTTSSFLDTQLEQIAATSQLSLRSQ